MLRVVAWIEVVAAVVLLAGALHPFSDFCTGRALGFDCESRAILAVHLLAPLGVLLAAGGIWLLRTGSMESQYTLALGGAALAAYWAYWGYIA